MTIRVSGLVLSLTSSAVTTHFSKRSLRLKDARMGRVHPRRRSHYTATERMAILELKASRGWSTQEAADLLHVTPATISSWQRRADDPDSAGLLELREPARQVPAVRSCCGQATEAAVFATRQIAERCHVGL